MKSMVFQVTAKTARLIGRENISDVDGAILELVKNGYDADAECVFIKYVNPFENVPDTLTLQETKEYFKNTHLLDKYYFIDNGKYRLKKKLENTAELDEYIMSLCSIYVIDNGSGMTKHVLENAWMNIGTDDKEKNIYSPQKNRIKTGAKGIGRFALDKLSLSTSVYTKAKGDKTYLWEIDWRQFDKADMLNQVEAKLEENSIDFIDIVHDIIGIENEILEKYNWSTGTIIKLSPIRSFWNSKLYLKVNKNLTNINPLGSVDIFDVYVSNVFNHDFDYIPEKESIERSCYDYKIDFSYDGDETVKLTLDRNEIDTSNIAVQLVFSETDVEKYNIDEFWQRDEFKQDKYTRDSFDKIQEFEFKLNELMSINDKVSTADIKSVGSFSGRFYYIKNQKSTVEIIKDFPVLKRKRLLDKFGGIKIYRDNFRIRPYGDYGHFYDWLNLSERVQTSPAAASHPTGKWRISNNQIIGSVSISRLNNSLLQDSANREGMTLNVQYDAFVALIDAILGKFEADRQYVLRAYADWLRSKEKAHTAKAQEIYEKFKSDLQNQKEKSEEERQQSAKEREYTKEELVGAIVALGNEKEKSVTKEELMMILGSSGVLAQTFSHEITRMETDFGTRGEQLRASIDYLLDYKEFEGDEDFNPYIQIDELDKTDLLLSEWVGLIMKSISKDKFVLSEVNLCDELKHIVDLWVPLLERKYISVSFEADGDYDLKLRAVDLHLLINNFILNSSYFLEDAEGERLIKIVLHKEGEKIYLDMMNNGPELDSKYKNNPDESLEPGETSKKDGTGLGLWIANDAVIRTDGSLHVIPVKDGYLLQASWII